MRVAVLMGGRTAEHEISLASGRMVVGHLDRRRYAVKPVVISRDGRWRVPRGYPGMRGLGGGGGFAPVGAGLARLLRERPDCVFIAMHGPHGEDGTIQGLLEILGLPYTGSGVCASALAMDKAKAKEIYLRNRIPTPPSVSIEAAAWERNPRAESARVRRSVGYPCVVKPSRLGSSVGASICRRGTELARAMTLANRYCPLVIAERYVRGREVTCAVIDTPGGRPPLALPPTEISPVTAAYFDYRAKYTAGASAEITPARIGKAVTERVRSLALRAHRALGCEGMSRTDMIIAGRAVTVLETNTIPGMTGTSLLPQAARAAGLPFGRLLDRLVATALESHRRRRRHDRVTIER
ncbi:MAG: D-alanine--D-alanine ligase [bacterium]|nr:D-alanine--D-alanine ligase [bacterium]